MMNGETRDVLFSIPAQRLKYTGVEIDVTAQIDIPVGLTTVAGANGSGKSALAAIIAEGRNYMTNHIETPTVQRPTVRTLTFSDLHSLTGMKAEYYQQRYESMNDEVPTVAQLLGDLTADPQWRAVANALDIDRMMGKHLNYLSSGELRKLLIVNALHERPTLLILDNPYIGLDTKAQATVSDAIARIVAEGSSIMMLVCDDADVHPLSDKVISMQRMRTAEHPAYSYRHDRGALSALIASHGHGKAAPSDTPIIQLSHCEVRYGNRVLVDDISWYIKAGECWALQGPNGSGKSTLLSLINADNPQAYSNDIRLWGQRRGTGESIWEVKRRIGFLSAELHLFFHGYNDTVGQIISRALRDTPADHGALAPERQRLYDGWLEVFGWQQMASMRFRDLSFGQQRLTLLIAAIAKMPEVLILDEPLHGLDSAVKRAVIDIIEALCADGTTLIYVTHNPEELPSCITHYKNMASAQ